MSSKRLIRFCILGIVMFFSSNTMANLVLSDGGPSGQWFNSIRSGEGFFIEIIAGPPEQISVAMYSFDENGDPLWLVGNVPIDSNDEIVDIPVFEFNGPVWGPGFDSDDLNTIPFGTITVMFPTCDTALFSVQSNGALQSGDYSLIRLTSVKGVGCTEPPEPPPENFPSGRWQGMGGNVCFMVSEDGTEIFGGDLSTCNAQSAFDSNLDGISNEGRECTVNVGCEGVWPIVDGKFTCFNDAGQLATGEFTSATSARGTTYEGEGGKGEFCSADWTASPD